MSNQNEPNQGDYAAYIDHLVNHGASSPGANTKPPSRTKSRRWQKRPDVFSSTGINPQTASAGLDPVVPQPLGSSSGSTEATFTTSSYSQTGSYDAGSTEKPETLASAAKKGVVARIMSVVSTLLFLSVFFQMSKAMGFGASGDMQWLFMALFAFVLFRMLKTIFTKKKPLQKLPPLTTISNDRYPPK